MILQIPGAIFGAAVGSFLGVIIDRQATGDKQQATNIGGRSRCSHCKRQLSWWENIPLVSFILLRGKCRTCRSPIPYWLPLVELAGALAAVWLAHWASQTITVITFIKVIGAVAIATALIWIFFSDLVKGLIPDWAVVLGVVGAIAISLMDHMSLMGLMAQVGIASAAAGFFLFLVLVTRGKGMGTGDITLVFFLGLWLGWPKIAVAVWLAFLLGAAVALGLIASGRKKFGQTVPFGPFLIAGGIIAKIWGSNLLQLFLTI